MGWLFRIYVAIKLLNNLISEVQWFRVPGSKLKFLVSSQDTPELERSQPKLFGTRFDECLGILIMEKLKFEIFVLRHSYFYSKITDFWAFYPSNIAFSWSFTQNWSMKATFCRQRHWITIVFVAKSHHKSALSMRIPFEYAVFPMAVWTDFWQVF